VSDNSAILTALGISHALILPKACPFFLQHAKLALQYMPCSMQSDFLGLALYIS